MGAGNITQRENGSRREAELSNISRHRREIYLREAADHIPLVENLMHTSKLNALIRLIVSKVGCLHLLNLVFPK